MKRKRGFTLIELVVVLFIIGTLLTVGIKFITSISKAKSDVEFTSYIYEVRQLLSLGKSFCRKYGVTGDIAMSLDKKTFVLSAGGSKINITKEIKFPSYINVGNNFKGNIIKIDESGFITTPGTINMVNKRDKNKLIEISIGVGNDIIGVKE
ncbi:hypothetical protein JCM1393_28020 [Clostridium carnis]